MTPEDIRCQSDRKLFDTLLEDVDVRRVNEQIAKQSEAGPMGVRRRLLATSVRLSRRMGRDFHKMADECIEKLAIEIPVELFVYSSPQFNAACFKPENERLYVMFSSSLLESFSMSGLRFVMGHELGHYVYQHHDIPIGYILNGDSRPSPKLALDLFAWSRYAEISADRAGAHCAEDLESVARALFRLASGLRGDTIEFSLDDFLQQVDEMQIEDAEPGQGAPREDWFSTHPFSPLRVKALQLFYESELARKGGESREQLESGVLNLMALMEPSYLEGRTDSAETMRRLLFAGAVAIAHADGAITEDEIELFEKFFGAGSFSSNLDIEQLLAGLPDRIDQAKEKISNSQCMQVVRDLCLIAAAEGFDTDKKIQTLTDIATALDLPPEFVNQVMASTFEPD